MHPILALAILGGAVLAGYLSHRKLQQARTLAERIPMPPRATRHECHEWMCVLTRAVHRIQPTTDIPHNAWVDVHIVLQVSEGDIIYAQRFRPDTDGVWLWEAAGRPGELTFNYVRREHIERVAIV